MNSNGVTLVEEYYKTHRKPKFSRRRCSQVTSTLSQVLILERALINTMPYNKGYTAAYTRGASFCKARLYPEFAVTNQVFRPSLHISTAQVDMCILVYSSYKQVLLAFLTGKVQPFELNERGIILRSCYVSLSTCMYMTESEYTEVVTHLILLVNVDATLDEFGSSL